jgi:hypothetical protein
VQHALAKKPKDKQLRAAEAKLFKDHADALIGPLAKWKKHLTWRLGFVDTATIDGKPMRAELDAILDHPSMAHVRELTLVVGHYAGPAVVLRLAGKPRPALRMLDLHQGYSSFDHDSEGGAEPPTYDTEWGSHAHKKGDALWKAAPNLEKLSVCGFGLFHSVELPHLKELAIEGYPVCGAVPMNLPKLETMSVALDCDDTGTGVDFETSTIAIAWKSKTPALRTLDLSKCDSVGYMDYEMFMEDSEGDDEDDIDDHLAWALRRDKAFKKLAGQLDLLAIPDEKFKGKPAIAKWLKG